MSSSYTRKTAGLSLTGRALRTMPGLRRVNRYLRHCLYRRLRVELKFLGHAVRNGYWPVVLRRAVRNRRHNPAHQAARWSTNIPSPTSSDGLTAWLKEQGLEVSEGWHAFYLPPQPGLAEVLGEAARQYPENSGFKILKSPGGVEESQYISSTRQPWLKRRAIGTPRQQVEVINYLHQLGLGPGVYDLVTLTAGDTELTAFVMEHLIGGTPSEAEYARFMQRLETALRDTNLARLPEWGSAQHDFIGPDCNGNLMRTGDQRETAYVDFQNFILKRSQT